MKKLIIWDFDGVISDTEKLWVTSRMDLLNRDLHLDWDFDTAMKYLGGRSDKDKRKVLYDLGFDVKDDLWEEAIKIDMIRLSEGLSLTEGVENIFKMSTFEQCIATGGTSYKTAEKIRQVGVGNYFPSQKVFTADLVKYGKPEPDIFLLAAETLRFDPVNCIVIEDSIAGLTAALRANMFPIAFVKYNKSDYINEIKELGIKDIFDDMNHIKDFLMKVAE